MDLALKGRDIVSCTSSGPYISLVVVHLVFAEEVDELLFEGLLRVVLFLPLYVLDDRMLMPDNDRVHPPTPEGSWAPGLSC
jgi:hypothetical protein